MGIETRNKSEREEIVWIASTFKNSEEGGLGKGAAVSVQTAVGLRMEDFEDQTKCRRKCCPAAIDSFNTFCRWALSPLMRSSATASVTDMEVKTFFGFLVTFSPIPFMTWFTSSSPMLPTPHDFP
jgi:hypothetical protein